LRVCPTIASRPSAIKRKADDNSSTSNTPTSSSTSSKSAKRTKADPVPTQSSKTPVSSSSSPAPPSVAGEGSVDAKKQKKKEKLKALKVCMMYLSFINSPFPYLYVVCRQKGRLVRDPNKEALKQKVTHSIGMKHIPSDLLWL
jgi:hypothetical protein